MQSRNQSDARQAEKAPTTSRSWPDPSAPGMGLNYRDERNSTEPMVVTVAERQGRNREAQAEGSRKQTGERRNTNGQRGRVRATSWLETTKSEHHQDAPGRVRRHAGRFQVLTRGELPCESGAAVSKGHSSVEAGRKPGGAKGRSPKTIRCKTRRGTDGFRHKRRLKQRDAATAATIPLASEGRSGAAAAGRRKRSRGRSRCEPRDGERCMSN
jgi:hypothetical protein